jgi:UDP-N-acetyl-D-mannosaminuronate dehydrogenase
MDTVLVVGLGEVGKPLLQLAGEQCRAIGIDVEPIARYEIGTVDVLHLCFPFEIPDFVGEAARYVELYEPRVTIVESTVAVGTTRAIHERTGAAVAHSPVRGKHSRMLEELRTYTKFVGGIDASAADAAAAHFQSLGLTTRTLPSPEATELAKLTETTYFGVLIAWAQEVERYCDQLDVAYEDVVSIYDEIGFFPRESYFPGVIGGHCVMPNIDILGELGPSALLDAVVESNRRKVEREAQRDLSAA